MFKVECPGCQAPYQVDERRVPRTGLKMRCPKCGSSFHVEPPDDGRRTGPSPVFGTDVETAPPAADQKPKAPRPPPRANPTVRSRFDKGTMMGVAPAGTLGGAGARDSDPYGEVDLPTVGGRGDAPATRGRVEPPRPAAVDVDEPAPASAPPALSDLGLDLPSLSTPERGKARSPSFAEPSFGELDLDLPVPAAPRVPSAAPAATRRSPDMFGEIDLPAPPAAPRISPAQQPTYRDLPAPGRPRGPDPVRGADPARGVEPARRVETASGELDLPSPAFDLPSPSMDLPLSIDGLPSLPSEASGLPVAAGVSELPSPFAQLPELQGRGVQKTSGPPSPGFAPLPSAPPARFSAPPLGAPEGSPSMPSPSGPPAPQFSLSDPPPEPGPRPAPEDGFGELDLPPLSARSEPPLSQGAPSVPFRSSALGGASVVREAGGGVSFGEVNLSGAQHSERLDTEAPLANRTNESMEFDAIPQEPAAPKSQRAPAPAVAEQPAVRPRREKAADAPKKGGRGGKVALAVIAGVLIAGGSLALVPEAGPFGAYWITDQLKRGDYERLLETTRQRVQAQLRPDSYPASTEALKTATSAQASAPRYRGLAAYAAYVAYLRELRFGGDPAARARAQVVLDELAERDARDVPSLELARTARAAAQGQLARARQELEARLASNPGDVDALILRAELELKSRSGKAAMAAWQAAAKAERSARTAFGVARAARAAGATEVAQREAERALEISPAHVGSRILLAELAWTNERNEKRALELLANVVAQPASASPGETVLAHSLLGNIHLARSRITHAENAYGEALKIDPRAAGALIGLGDALFRAGRYSEALARFEAAAQADPDDVAAKVGVARTKLALERMQEALDMLKKLREQNPNSALVNYWYGKALEASGDRKQAEAAYRAGIASGSSTENVVDAYFALALLLNQLGRSEEAQASLDGAQKKLPNSPAVYKALGELALSQGRNAAAVEALERALQLDADDVGAKFRLAVALRRDRRFDRAAAVFDEVAQIDREYPGLALERGVLFEASGKTQEALKAYESALAKAPNDPDLMLRVGCGKVSAGRPEQAVELLRKVLGSRPNSAETNHCLGRALLLEGKNLAEALRLLERAVELDPHRAEYHLYVGWAANEAGRIPRAEAALGQALTLDRGLGDAYWQRGVLRYRQGAVKDAVEDLRQALVLNPGRFEAHAALADSLYDLGREPEALSEWQLAVQAQPENATWRFRYGKLLAANHKNAEAREHLSQAITLAEQEQPKPRWLWEAHHLLARAYGGAKEAAPHWEEFLKLGPRDSPYRAEAKAALEKAGRPWSGN